MSFFEQLGKRLSDAGQGVAQQTKNFADVTRLNGVISGKEKQIAQLYAAIGQAYYQSHKNDAAAEQLEQIQSINTLFQEIAQCQEEIKQIKGVTKCPNCGADVPLNTAFCSACGAKQPEVQPEQPAPAPTGRTCPNCHAPVEEGAQFCIHCGTRME